MYTYSSNWMGPLCNDPDGLSWSGGRIDVYGGEGYPSEIGLPIMLSTDFNTFSDWLDNFSSPTVLTLEELLNLYYLSGFSEVRFKLAITPLRGSNL